MAARPRTVIRRQQRRRPGMQRSLYVSDVVAAAASQKLQEKGDAVYIYIPILLSNVFI